MPEIDTSPAALRALADRLAPEPGVHQYRDGDLAAIAALPRALADEKEAATVKPDLTVGADSSLSVRSETLDFLTELQSFASMCERSLSVEDGPMLAAKFRDAAFCISIAAQQVAADRATIDDLRASLAAAEKARDQAIAMAEAAAKFAVADDVERAALKARAEKAEAERDAACWQPIETAPRDGTLIDLWAGERIANCAWNVPSKCWGERIGVGSGWKYWAVVLDPTHWMPLPAEPANPEDPPMQNEIRSCRCPKEHDEIWLSPPCDGEAQDGRLWARDNAFDPCPECGAEAVRFVRADLADPPCDPADPCATAYDLAFERNTLDGLWAETKDRLAAAQAEIARLREALKPFGQAWETALGQTNGKHTTLGAFSALASYYLSSVDYQKARAALAETAATPAPAPAPADDGWTAWEGGECPVGPLVRVDVRFDDGTSLEGAHAQTFDWDADDDEAIVAYRMAKGTHNET